MTWLIRTRLDQFAWQADVFERVPFKHIAWKSTLGAPYPNLGLVHFDDLGGCRSRVRIRVRFNPSTRAGHPGDPVPFVRQIMERSLRCFHRQIVNQ